MMFWIIFEIVLIITGFIAVGKCIDACTTFISLKGILLGLCVLIVFGFVGIVVISSHKYIPITIGIDAAIIVFTVFTIREEDRLRKKHLKEEYQKRCNYVVRNAVNQTLNRNVSNYLKKGKVYDDYYSYSYVSDYSKILNQGFKEFIEEYKYRLLERIKSSEYCKVFQTESGKYAEVYLGYICYNEVTDDEHFRFPYACLNPNNHSTFYKTVFKRYGFIFREHHRMVIEGRLDIMYDVYACVKLEQYRAKTSKNTNTCIRVTCSGSWK